MKGASAAFLVCFLMCFLSTVHAQEAVSWELAKDAEKQVIRLQLTEQSSEREPRPLQVFVGVYTEYPGTEKTAMLGTTIPKEGGLTFQPTFPFRTGITYTAFWDQGDAFVFKIPETSAQTTLLKIYPSGQVLPANLLKAYLHFSAPMGEGRAYEHLTLISSAGDTVHQPFVPLQPELWSEDRKRLTLWLDPGRVKRGLLSHDTHGVVIEQGQEYTLIIDPDWKDASGKRLGQGYRKQFRVGAPDYDQPRPANWSYKMPDVGTTAPLYIDFGEAMDHALASRQLTVRLEPDELIHGEVILENQESRWSFYPELPWKAGHYSIRVDTDLEDLAGNNLNRPFDREIVAGEKREVERDFYKIEFNIKASE